MIAGPASFLYAGLLGLLLVALSAQVSLTRRRPRVTLGAGAEEGMRQAIRVQANFVEYAPFAHAIGLSLSPGRSFGRFYGVAGTWLVILALSLWLLWATTAASRSPVPG